MGIYIEAENLLDEHDWKRLRIEALEELVNERGPVSSGFIGDLVDARAALLGGRSGAALIYLERAIAELKR